MTVPGASSGREYEQGVTGPGRRTVSGAVSGPACRAVLSRGAAFWLVAGVLFLLFFAAAAPSPLYSVYQSGGGSPQSR